MNNLLSKLKQLSHNINEELVALAENEGMTESDDWNEGYIEGLRQYHLEVIELIQEYEE